ncbi:NAD(P)/FAD-dependent oxidoreductase [Paenibacillus macerans]|uniref:NAD(P)/FAD-dependent oxidoreductase n=1 Tax=Paenibacillus macerans TaxID=44252 RepID=UPI0022DF9536|nr:NAD(P)/FAD-dependent oxidoreductase [Paenibacillus macerans]MBS5910459.1 NAD(P)/FAD-dependent oxidoreductase [Paenibacillus macerans]MEC0138669.1 NAD(P)/FAD-dependent oxidoreductase [Paenibacillus macerans]
MTTLLDVGIIGGGPAGLNAALVLGRARKSVAVIDEGRPRNRVTGESHGFLTRDGIKPAEFRRIAKEQIQAYPTVRFVEDTAVKLSGEDGHFQITTARGETLYTKKLLIASGMKDAPLDIPGLADVYGKSAFVCPYCDGWEMRDRPLAVIVPRDHALHMAKMISGWTAQFAMCIHGQGEWPEGHREELERRQVPVFDLPIERIDSEEGMVRQVVLEDGTAVPCTGIFFAPKLVPGSGLPQTLGCDMTEGGAMVVDDLGKTNVPGVYGAGDAASVKYQVIAAAAAGAFAGIAINNELQEEAWSRKEE